MHRLARKLNTCVCAIADSRCDRGVGGLGTGRLCLLRIANAAANVVKVLGDRNAFVSTSRILGAERHLWDLPPGSRASDCEAQGDCA